MSSKLNMPKMFPSVAFVAVVVGAVLMAVADARAVDTSTPTATKTATATRTSTRTATITPTATPIQWTICLDRTPVLVATSWSRRSTLSVGNPSPDVDVFYGDRYATVNNGQLLPHGAVQFWSIERGGQLEWWACAASPTVCIHLLSVDE